MDTKKLMNVLRKEAIFLFFLALGGVPTIYLMGDYAVTDVPVIVIKWLGGGIVGILCWRLFEWLRDG